MPSPGLVRAIRPASGPGIRDDSGVTEGYTVPVFYDSMIAKLVAWAGDRRAAIARTARALAEYEVLGIKTTIPFFRWLMLQDDFIEGRFDTTYLDRLLADRKGASFSTLSEADEHRIAIAAGLDAWMRANASTGQPARAEAANAWTTVARREALGA